MAGSMKFFAYTSDDGTDWALYRDESNTEVVNAATQDFPDAGTVKYKLPANVTPRYIRFRSSAGTVQRKIVALTTTIYNAYLVGTTYVDPVSGLTLIAVEKVGEKIRLPIGQDTGLTDGDAT